MKIKIDLNARTVALVGIMAATIECGKIVLSALPNIEVVTILCALYGYVFGIYGVIAAGLFVLIEPLIWGFGSWLIYYIIYWPLVALVFMLLAKRGVDRRLPLTAVALGLTIFFGILSTVTDCAFYFGINENYLINLPVYYVRGLPFYVAQLATNLALFPTLFLLLADRLGKIKQSFLK